MRTATAAAVVPEIVPPLGVSNFGRPENSVMAELTVCSNGESEYTRLARIWSASDGFFRLIVDVEIEPGARVEIHFERCHAFGEIAFCQRWADGYNVGVQLLNDPALRREPRFPIQLTGTLTVLGDQGPRQMQIDLIDVSASGVGMLAPKAIPAGVCVEISMESGVLFGEIRHCDETSEGAFRAGVKMYHMVAKEPVVTRVKNSNSLLGWLRRPR